MRTDLASLTHARQVRAVQRCDALAARVDRAAHRVWRDLMAEVRRAQSFGKTLDAVAVRLRALPHLLRWELADGLHAMVEWGHQSARYALGRALPKEVLRRAVRGPARSDRGRTEAVSRLRHRAGSAVAESLDAGGGLVQPEPTFAWDDLFGAFREPQSGTVLGAHRGEPSASHADFLALLFPAPSRERVDQIVYASGWEERLAAGTGLAAPQAVAARVATGMMLGHSQQEVAALILPAVQAVQASARRLARTEGLRVAAAVQMDAHAGLGDLVVGYRIHATLDANTRPLHRARDGTTYWAHPAAGQPGYDQMPHPPQEAGGSMAWNCRCYLTPVLRS